MNKQIICTNRKARFEYEILETIECGMVLHGTEIKSIRQKNVSLDESFAMVEKSELFLINCNIQPYKQANQFNHEPKRQKKLLIKKAEMQSLAKQTKIKGLTLIPLSLYLKGNKAKVELAVCRGKQQHDKREAVKKRDAERTIRQWN